LKVDSSFIYYWLACFHMAGVGLTPEELCRMAEAAVGEHLSPEILEGKIEELRSLPLEERERLKKTVRKFLQVLHDMEL